jgi:hypothetical protein
MKNENNIPFSNENIKPYERRLNDQGDDVCYRFIMYNPAEEMLKEITEDYLKIKNYKFVDNNDYTSIKKTQNTRKTTYVYNFHGNVQKTLATYYLIYKQQKFYV